MQAPQRLLRLQRLDLQQCTSQQLWYEPRQSTAREGARAPCSQAAAPKSTQTAAQLREQQRASWVKISDRFSVGEIVRRCLKMPSRQLPQRGVPVATPVQVLPHSRRLGRGLRAPLMREHGTCGSLTVWAQPPKRPFFNILQAWKHPLDRHYCHRRALSSISRPPTRSNKKGRW